MKIKVIPEDFIVEEIVNYPIKSEGKYAIFKLKKRYWETFSLLNRIEKDTGMKKEFIHLAGIKDRYGLTTQLIAVNKEYAICKSFSGSNYSLEFLGFGDEKLTASHIVKNRFTIVLRDIKVNDVQKIEEAINQVKNYGFPNYYDEQRFGSARHRKGFAGKELFLKNYENALFLLVATPSGYDDRKTREFHKFVRENWGNWKSCLEKSFFEYKAVFRALIKQPKNFLYALQKLDKRFLVLLVNAYQSFLWNEYVALYLKSILKNTKDEIYEYPYLLGKFLFYRTLDKKVKDYLIQKTIPVIKKGTKISDKRLRSAISKVLRKEGIKKSDLSVKSLHIRLQEKERKLIIVPEHLEILEIAPDERYKNRMKIKFLLELPRGSYATIFIKRITPIK
ncbi:MAG: tRNA pseudouridine(13) synthase TruD [Candidatus Desulfofervidus auxilii]|nr:tRNA pseudouridine(13) synthase TruD [Candidatus Desulfofervidus auxilii]